jgi:hypothetical protein
MLSWMARILTSRGSVARSRRPCFGGLSVKLEESGVDFDDIVFMLVDLGPGAVSIVDLVGADLGNLFLLFYQDTLNIPALYLQALQPSRDIPKGIYDAIVFGAHWST